MASIVRFPADSPKRKVQTTDEIIEKQIDELQRLSDEERDRQLGSSWYKEVNDFYTLTGMNTSSAPSFRPRVIIPELQTLMMAEATDTSESFPKVFITKKGERDKTREKAFQEHWRQQQYNIEQLFAELWALFTGTGFFQVGFDAEARRGRGEVWMKSRDPQTAFVDPGTLDNEHWVYSGWEDRMYIDEICRCWPEAGGRLRRQSRGYVNMRVGTDDGSGPGGLDLPEGPMRYGSGGVPQQRVTGDGRLRVRQLYINDYSRVELSKQERAMIADRLGPLTPSPQFKMKFPRGRWIVQSEGITLADGDNPFPFKRSPLIPIQAMPRLKSFWVPPPIRYSKSLQELSERMFTGVFENATRLNNGTWFIDERTGIDPSDFGGLPAEIRVINATSPVPEVRYGQAMPPHFTQLPELLLSKQRTIHGFTPTRSGQPGAGNIAQGLYDASVFQSQVLTRMRAKLMAPALQQLAELVFYTMMRYYQSEDMSFPGFGGSTVEMQQWKPAGTDWEDKYDMYLEPGSIKPLSASFLRGLVTMLLEKGHVPLKYALEMLEIPDAESIAEERREELELGAMSKLRRPR